MGKDFAQHVLNHALVDGKTLFSSYVRTTNSYPIAQLRLGEREGKHNDPTTQVRKNNNNTYSRTLNDSGLSIF